MRNSPQSGILSIFCWGWFNGHWRVKPCNIAVLNYKLIVPIFVVAPIVTVTLFKITKLKGAFGVTVTE